MIDFSNGTFIKLSPSDPREIQGEIGAMLVEGEQIYLAFRGIRDSVGFTNKRLMSINVQGMTGKKGDYTSLPYSRIHAWSVETAGALTSTRSWNCGSAGPVRFGWSSRARSTSAPSAY